MIYRGRGHDVGFVPPARPPARSAEPDVPARTPEQAAEADAERTREEVTLLAKQLEDVIAQCVSLPEWNQHKAKLEEKVDNLEHRVRGRFAQDAAKKSERAAAGLEKAGKALTEIKTKLSAERSLRPVPPVDGEVAIEPSIVDRSAHPDDVFAWAARLPVRQREAFRDRITNRSAEDTFAAALLNYLAPRRLLAPFKELLRDPKRRFDLAAYERGRIARGLAPETSSAEHGHGASIGAELAAVLVGDGARADEQDASKQDASAAHQMRTPVRASEHADAASAHANKPSTSPKGHAAQDPPLQSEPRERSEREGLEPAPGAASTRDPDERLQLPPGRHYARIAGSHAFVIDVPWFLDGATPKGGRMVAPGKMLEVLRHLREQGVFAGASDENLARAAEDLGIAPSTRSEQVIRLGADVFGKIGLPANSTAMVSTHTDGFMVAVRTDVPLARGMRVAVSGETAEAVFRALESYTGLTVLASYRLPSFPMTAGEGAVFKHISRDALEKMFGPEQWRPWWATHGERFLGEEGAAQSVSSELTPAEQARLRAWLDRVLLGSASPRLTRDMFLLMEEVENSEYRDQIRAALARDAVVALAAGGAGGVDEHKLRVYVHAAKYEAERSKHVPLDRLGDVVVGAEADAALISDQLPAQLVAGGGLIVDGDTVQFEVKTDWHRNPMSAEKRDAFARRPWKIDIDWTFERPGEKAHKHTSGTSSDSASCSHRLKLKPGERSAIWTVHAFVRTSHFLPTHLGPIQIEVKTEDARMEDLRGEALGKDAASAMVSAEHDFDIGAIDDKISKRSDDHGKLWIGPKGFTSRTPEQRAQERTAEIEHLEGMLAYFDKHPGKYNDARAAVERTIARRKEEDKAIRQAEASGVLTFDVRATFLSRDDDVPSGPLDIIGMVRPLDPRIGQIAGADASTKVVTLRDSTRRFDAETMTVTGLGATFEQALESAFVALCKSYPDGRISLFAEERDPSGTVTTSRTIGFELATTSSVKSIKRKVFAPAVQIGIALASAMAAMFPPAIAAIPLMIGVVHGTAATLDEIIDRGRKGQLDRHKFLFGQLALGLLPAVRMARVVQSRAGLMYALDMSDTVGNVVMLAPQIKETLEAMQARDVEGLAQLYGEMMQMEQSSHASDPALAKRRAEFEQRAQAFRDHLYRAFNEAAGQQVLFMAPGHIFKGVHGHGGASDGPAHTVDRGFDPERTQVVDANTTAQTAPHATTERQRSSSPSDANAQAHDSATDAPRTRPTATATHESTQQEPNRTAQHDSSETQPPKRPGPAGSGAGEPPGSGMQRPPSIASESVATADEQAVIDAAVADREAAAKARPAADEKHLAGKHIANEFRTEQEADYSRWQSKGLEEDPRGRKLLEDPEFRHWYDRWMSMPDNVTADADGMLHVKLPHGVPDAIAAKLRAVAENGNIGLMARAEYVRKRIAEALPGKTLDPNAKDWPETRAKLVEIVGEDAARKFEIEKTERMDARGGERGAVDDLLDAEIDGSEFQSLREMYPGTEIYVTGSGAQPDKAQQALKAKRPLDDLDLVLVVPDGTPPNIRTEIEARLSGMELKRPKPKPGEEPRPPIPVDGKVMTQSEFAGWSMMKTPAGSSVLANARIDTWSNQPVPGTGASGVDLHNHIMGVPGTDYYVNRIGKGSAIDVLEKAWILVQKHPDEIKPTTKTAIASAISDIRNGAQAGLSREALETRARRGLDQALAAHPHEMPFDHTYDLRDLLVQQHIDPASPENPNGAFETFAADMLIAQHAQGVTSSEQSVSIKKLNQRFDEATMARAHERAKAQGKDSELRFLAMLPTDKILSAKPGEVQLDPKLREQLEKILKRADVKGIDFAGPEAQLFTTPEGMAQFKQMYGLLVGAARQRGEPLVLRPHVGEGYDPHGSGEHVKVAQHNLEMLLRTLDELGYKAGGDVIIRFGHATHATDAQLQHMQRLGIIVEANVGSNLATGSIANVGEHPLLRNLYFGVSTTLATDAQGVMNTTLVDEYRRAAELIERFRRGEIALQVGTETKRFSDLTPEQQDRFSLRWLEQQVANYREASRPKPKSRNEPSGNPEPSKEDR